MRFLTVLILSMSSAYAIACPDLTGTYNCKDQNQSVETVTFLTKYEDGVFVYTYNGSRIPADNYSYYMPDDEHLKWRYFRAWCDAADPNSFQTQLNGQYYREGNYHGYLTINTTFSRTSNGIKIGTSSWLKSKDGEFPMNSEMDCTKRSPY